MDYVIYRIKKGHKQVDTIFEEDAVRLPRKNNVNDWNSLP